MKIQEGLADVSPIIQLQIKLSFTSFPSAIALCSQKIPAESGCLVLGKKNQLCETRNQKNACVIERLMKVSSTIKLQMQPLTFYFRSSPWRMEEIYNDLPTFRVFSKRNSWYNNFCTPQKRRFLKKIIL